MKIFRRTIYRYRPLSNLSHFLGRAYTFWSDLHPSPASASSLQLRHRLSLGLCRSQRKPDRLVSELTQRRAAGLWHGIKVERAHRGATYQLRYDLSSGTPPPVLLLHTLCAASSSFLVSTRQQFVYSSVSVACAMGLCQTQPGQGYLWRQTVGKINKQGV